MRCFWKNCTQEATKRVKSGGYFTNLCQWHYDENERLATEWGGYSSVRPSPKWLRTDLSG